MSPLAFLILVFGPRQKQEETRSSSATRVETTGAVVKKLGRCYGSRSCSWRILSRRPPTFCDDKMLSLSTWLHYCLRGRRTGNADLYTLRPWFAAQSNQMLLIAPESKNQLSKPLDASGAGGTQAMGKRMGVDSCRLVGSRLWNRRVTIHAATVGNA